MAHLDLVPVERISIAGDKIQIDSYEPVVTDGRGRHSEADSLCLTEGRQSCGLTGSVKLFPSGPNVRIADFD
jgi:hypothetical protein